MRVPVHVAISLLTVAITLRADVLPAAYDVSVNYWIDSTDTLNSEKNTLAASGTSALLSGVCAINGSPNGVRHFVCRGGRSREQVIDAGH